MVTQLLISVLAYIRNLLLPVYLVQQLWVWQRLWATASWPPLSPFLPWAAPLTGATLASPPAAPLPTPTRLRGHLQQVLVFLHK